MALIDPTEHLKREDKWYVGGGEMLIYAPPFPEYDALPGYWDTCHFGNLRLPHLLAVTFVEDGRELKPRLESHTWFPDRSIYEYTLAPGLALTMTRRCQPESVLSCELVLLNAGRKNRRVDVVLWTLRQTREGGRKHLARDFDLSKGEISYVHVFYARSPKPVFLRVRTSANRKPASYQMTPAHNAAPVPEFRFTPFWQFLREGRLTNDIVRENVLGGAVYAALHYRVALPAKASRNLVANLRVEFVEKEDRARRGSLAAPGVVVSRRKSRAGRTAGLVPDWQHFAAIVPHFECSDEFITRYYWYRWFGIWLNSIPGGVVPNCPFPAVYEGIDYFRGLITYSLMCHVRETKWLRDPSLAQGCVRNHIAHQTRAGHFVGHIYVGHVNDRVFYHTDWGGALAELAAHHPDTAFESEAYLALVDYLRYFLHQRDREDSYLFDVTDQFETGQELSSRYFFAGEKADLYGWESRLRMKGVDATYYIWRLAVYLAQAAARQGHQQETEEFRQLADNIAAAIRQKMWDAQRDFFFDYDEEKAARSPFWSSVGFYPAGSEIAGSKMVSAALKHLFRKDKFGTPYPTPTSPVDDPYFSAEPRWRGERANCPWNGRVWPMLNSHIVEVLGHASELDSQYRKKLASYLKSYLHMMFFDGDPSRPNSFEHYHPFDGSPSIYRGVDDYQHSWVADLILKYVAGVRAKAHGLVVDPFPFALDWFLLKDAYVHGHHLDVEWNRDAAGKKKPGYRIRLDGEEVVAAKKLKRWEHVW